MNKFAVSFLACAFLVAVAPASNAQATKEPAHAPDGGTTERLMSIFIPPLLNAPFSCTLTTEWAKVLEDGTTVTIQNHRAVMRDHAGRIFQERRSFVPKGSQQEPEVIRVEISDPGTHRKYFCNPRQNACGMFGYFAPTVVALPSAGSLMDGKASLTRQDLGKRTVSGVEVNGTLETTVINAGVMGNDRPISITKEFWFSPQLGINVMVKRVDPRHGTEIFTVSDLSLAEPDPKYFSVPAGFVIKDHLSGSSTPPQEPEE